MDERERKLWGEMVAKSWNPLEWFEEGAPPEKPPGEPRPQLPWPWESPSECNCGGGCCGM